MVQRPADGCAGGCRHAGAERSPAMSASLSRQTPLTQRHESLSANMAEFAGYRMPLWYATGARKEHLSVITAAGLFDTSHMATVGVSGGGAFSLLQQCFTKDLSACIGPRSLPLGPGKSVYGAFLEDSGHVIDDGIVFCTAPQDFLVVVNAAMGPRIAGHLASWVPSAGEATIIDYTDRLGKIDIQGPLSARIVAMVVDGAAAAIEKMTYFSFKGHFDANHPNAATIRMHGEVPILLSRTGYTGELGFELFMDAGSTGRVWDALLAAGEPHGLIPCGLAARDSLRAGAVLPLSHQDIGAWPFIHHPWEFALPWNQDQTGFTKAFLGDRALSDPGDAPYTRAFVGDDLRKVAAGDARVLDTRRHPIGNVLTCATDMAIGRVADRVVSLSSPNRPDHFCPRGLSCGFVKVSTPLPTGTRIHLEDNRRTIAATIVDDVRPDRSARRPITQMLKL
jgi:aminomethyltransferase